MACGGCSKRRAARTATPRGGNVYDVLGGYKNLPNRQLKARLEHFKKLYCKDCDLRYQCDYAMYKNCDIRPK